MNYPTLRFGTPRKLPKPHELPGRVIVLDIAFASTVAGASFERVTKPFIDGLGSRLRRWVDHHDHELHQNFRNDPRFVLATKQQHGACPEMLTPQLVETTGPYESICCHVDFDGICAAAKWVRGGYEPYPGADRDAWAIDTRMATPSGRGELLDRALRGRPRDDGLRGLVFRYLAQGGQDESVVGPIRAAAAHFSRLEGEAKRLAQQYTSSSAIAVCDARKRSGPYDKTTLLLLGQKQAPVSLVHDEASVTVAARFDSGINLLALLGLEGGMPTRVSVTPNKLEWVLERLSEAKLR